MRDRHGHGPGWGRGFGIGIGFDFPRVRARRGDVKYLLLEILKDGPKHGYEMMTELEGRFRGYRASAGSVYPTLQMLEEGGFVTSEQVDEKNCSKGCNVHTVFPHDDRAVRSQKREL